MQAARGSPPHHAIVAFHSAQGLVNCMDIPQSDRPVTNQWELLEEAGRSEQNEAVQVMGAVEATAHDSVD